MDRTTTTSTSTRRILEVVEGLWEIGKAVAELPDREDEALIPYPYPEKDTILVL